MRNDYYPAGTVRALLQSDFVTPASYHEMKDRLDQEDVAEPRFFDSGLFTTLRAVCECLIPQPLGRKLVDIAGALDRLVSEGKGNGWRYDVMPPDDEAYKKGLEGINETSHIMFGSIFPSLDKPKQFQVLESIQSGTADGNTWKTIPAEIFFEELLAILVEIYYSHPLAREEIGDVSMADAKGWQKIGLDELEDHEPQSINT